MSLTMADYGSVCTPGRSSARLKARKVFSMPSRDEVLEKIQVDRTPHKSLDHFRPRKLIHDFVKGHNRYNNTDPVSLWEDGAMSDFIVDDEEEVGEEESDDTASSAESQSNDSGDEEEEEESSDDDVKRGRKNTTSQADRLVLRKRRKSKQISSSDESGEESIKESQNSASKVECDRNQRARRKCVSKRRVVSTTKVKVDNNHNERIKGKVGNVKNQDNGDVDELEDEESFVTLRRGHRKKKSPMIESSDDDIGSGEDEQEDTDEEDQINRPHRKRKKTIESSDESDGDECQVSSPTTTQHKRAANRRHHYELRGTRLPQVKTQTMEKNSLEKSCQKKMPVEASSREAGSDSDEELSFNASRGQRRKRRATIESSEDDLDSGEKEQEETDEENQINKPLRKMKKAIESSDESDGDERQVSSSTTTQHKRAANRRHHYELRGTRFPKDKTQTVEKSLLEKSCQKKTPVEASGREAGSDSDEELSFNAPRGQRRQRRATIESSDDDLDSGEKEQEETDEENQINKPSRKMKKAIESSDERDGDKNKVTSPTTTQHKRAANRRHHYELRGTRFPKDKTQTVEKNLLEKSCQKKMPVEASGREAGSDSDEELSFNAPRGQRRKRRATIESSEDDHNSGGEDE